MLSYRRHFLHMRSKYRRRTLALIISKDIHGAGGLIRSQLVKIQFSYYQIDQFTAYYQIVKIQFITQNTPPD